MHLFEENDRQVLKKEAQSIPEVCLVGFFLSLLPKLLPRTKLKKEIVIGRKGTQQKNNR